MNLLATGPREPSLDACLEMLIALVHLIFLIALITLITLSMVSAFI